MINLYDEIKYLYSAMCHSCSSKSVNLCKMCKTYQTKDKVLRAVKGMEVNDGAE